MLKIVSSPEIPATTLTTNMTNISVNNKYQAPPFKKNGRSPTSTPETDQWEDIIVAQNANVDYRRVIGYTNAGIAGSVVKFMERCDHWERPHDHSKRYEEG